MNTAAILLGYGGHGGVISSLATGGGLSIELISDPSLNSQEIVLDGKQIKCISDNDVEGYSVEEYVLLNGIGYLPNNSKRREIFSKFRKLGFRFPILAHKSAFIDCKATLSEGAQVFAGAVVQPGCSVGENCIVNTASSIDHDSVIGAHSHIAPGVTICGNVQIGEAVFIGAGSTIVNDVRIPDHTIIGAGQLVTKSNVEDVTRKRRIE